ncbi:MAG: ABC transporter ATP-binding protein [Gaiellales bacterium]
MAGNPARAGDRPFVELRGITKSYPGVVANDDVSLDLYRGEVHCLLGENGAGKSTLISILSGIVKPDEGTIRIEGEPVELSSPRVALQHGVGTVYQHSTLIPALTVLENLMLGNTRALRLDAAGARRRLVELGATLGVEVDPDSITSDLSLGSQQQVEIVNALWRGSRLLILDEPTSMLTPQGFAELGKVITRLKAEGLAVVFITHKLHEALALGDRVSILRQGRVVGSLDPARMQSSSPDELRDEIIQIMFGEEAQQLSDAPELQEALPERAARTTLRNEVVLELDRVSAAGVGSELGIDEVSLKLRQGEVLGVAGVDGNGQRALAEAIAGQRPLSAGQVELFGAPINRLNVAQRQKLGLRYVTDDRLGEGIVRSMSVDINLFLKRIGQAPFWRFGRIQRAEVERTATDLVREFDVRTPSLKTRSATLSGGNIQKLLLARELSFEPKVVIFNKPTYGLDLKTTHAVRDTIRTLTGSGVAALVISTDLDELIETCDEIAVISRGRLIGLIDNAPGAAERIGALMVGSGSELPTPEVIAP